MDRKSPCPKSTGMKIPRTATVLSWQMGPKQPRRPQVVQGALAGASPEGSQQPVVVLVRVTGAVHMRGGGPSTSGAGGSGGKKRGRDGDDDDDDPNKCRKTGDGGKQPKPQVARKEPRKKGTAYPPIDRKLPPLYISRPKERTELGYRVLDWTAEQKRKIHEARMQGRQIKPHRYRAGTVALKDIRHYQGQYSVAHPKVAFPEGGERNRSGYQDRPAVPVSGGTVSPRGNRGVPCRVVR